MGNKNDLKEVVIYTDGGALGNPGPGGYGVVLLYGNRRKEISEGFRLTTNNRMEIQATIAGLKALKYRCRVTIYSDSRYLVNAINLGWLQSWKANGWKRGKKKPVLNMDLWQELDRLLQKHEVKFVWVESHAGIRENERCDELTQQAARGRSLKIDFGYEQIKLSSQKEKP